MDAEHSAPAEQTAQTEALEYAVVEIMGHRRLAGRILEVERFGAKMLRIDVPTKGDFANGFLSQFYSGAALFSVTHTDLDTVCRMNKPYEPPRLMSSQGARDAGFLDDDPDDDEEEETAGRCESCNRVLKAGDLGHRDPDGVVTCEEHSPTWADAKEQYEASTPDDYDDPEDHARGLARATQEVAEGNGAGKIVFPL